MPRKKQRTQKKRAIEEADPSIPETAQKSRKVSRFQTASDGITIEVHYSPTKQPYNLGCFKINSISSGILLPSKFKIKFEQDGACFIQEAIHESIDSNEVPDMSKMSAYQATYEIPYDILKLLTSLNLFRFFLHQFSNLVGAFYVDVYFDSSKFLPLKEASEPVYRHYQQRRGHYLQRILEFFLGMTFDVYKNYHVYEDQIQKIYSCIQNCYNAESSSEFSHEAFLPKLRKYQSQALSWMLQRELENSCKFSGNDLHQLYTAITLKDGYTLYYHKYGEFFVDQKYPPDIPCKGGLLADEMGLGKTLEVLACILMNPRKLMETQNNENIKNGISHNKEQEEIDDEIYPVQCEEIDPASFGCYCGGTEENYSVVRCVECKVMQHPQCMQYEPEATLTYKCPFCLEKDIVSSRATLIISPATIIRQWEEEIKKHIKGNYLKVFMYLGVESQKYVHPRILSDNDVVLVSYETLKKELSHVDIAYGRAGHSLRHVKKFISIPSPLSSIEWWRICLDEAQMVENVTSKVARMVGKLYSINRWCVSGTPIKKSVQDLYGLFVFLNVKPYHEKMWWKEAIFDPFVKGNIEPLSSALNNIAWATKKCQVLDQIGLQEVIEVTKILKFSPVERVYYEKRHSEGLGEFMEKISKCGTLDIKLQYVDKSVLKQILKPMSALQQVCGHFQVTQPVVEINKKTMGTTELLDMLLKTATYECEKIHRQYIMAQNGLAGIYMIEQNYKCAVAIFEKTLQSMEDYKEHIRTDASQQVHCLFHLSNALKSSRKKGKTVQSKFKSSELDEKVKEISESYFEKNRTALLACKDELMTAQKAVSKDFSDLVQKKDSFPTSSWWCDFIEMLSKQECDAFLKKLPEVLERATSGTIFQRDQNFRRCILEYKVPEFKDLLLRWTSELHNERKILLDVIEDISQEPDALTLESAISCHLRPVEGSPKCKYCQAVNVFKSFESKLYVIEETTTVVHNGDNSTKQVTTRNRKHPCGPLEICLDYVDSFMQQYQKGPKDGICVGLLECMNDGYHELHLIGSLKKEFKILSNLWKKYCDYVSGMDEMEMAKLSIKMIPFNQKRPDSAASYCIYPHEVKSYKLQYQSEIMECAPQLKLKLGKLHYLKNLKKVENKDAPFEENCPVCCLKIEDAWYVLQCGHCFCVSCTTELKGRNKVPAPASYKGFHCPLCRQFSSASNMNLLMARNEEENNKFPLKNFYSTKVNAVIRCLMKIKKDETGAQSLVFSSFPGLLNILERALAENDVQCLNLCNTKHFQEDLQRFKKHPCIKALLMPLNSSSSGLNITEANHVLLLEPVLDNSLHHQAIGRVHRIGQQKQVTVHRFIIKDSIEESIYASRSTSADKKSESNLTLNDLKNIFKQDS